MSDPSRAPHPEARRPLGLAVGGATLASLVLLSFALPTPALAGGLMLNEYNAVATGLWLNGGDALADVDGGLAGDATWGRIESNGGDWFELVVTENGLDLRGWQLVLSENGVIKDTLVLSQDPIWTTLQAGTIITVSEQYADDVSYDPAAGDWHINVQAVNGGSGSYISAESFPVSNSTWQIEILDDLSITQYGPSGEGVGPSAGVNDREIARLEENPSDLISESSLCYDDADTYSTWGLPNQWSSGTKAQDFAPLRGGTAPTTQCGDSDLTALGYDPERLLDVEITMDSADYEELRRQSRRLMDTFGGACGLSPPPSPYTFFPASVTVDGTTLTGAGVRKKGFFGSPDIVKPSFKVDFEEFGGQQHVYSMERMTLNNGRQDPSLLDQCLGYGLFRAAGLAASRCNFAHVKVNGVSKGIYMNVESIKDPFLLRNYGDSSGNLYEGTTADFREYWIGLIEKKNNVDGTDLEAVQAALEIVDDTEFLAALGALVDLDKFMTYWALSGLIGDWDGYAGNANNFWLYNNPSTGLFEFMPWSLDDIFGRDNPLVSLGGAGEARTVFETAALTNRLWKIPSIQLAYEAEINNLISALWDEVALLAEIDRMQALITPVAGDLSGPIGETRSWISGRAAKVADDFAGGPPALASTLPMKNCLEPAGSIAGSFSSTYTDPLPLDITPGSTFSDISFDLNGNGTMFGIGTGLGVDSLAGPGKLTLRPIGILNMNVGFVFNIVIDEEDFVVHNPLTAVPVADTIASFLLALNPLSQAVFPIGMVTDPMLTVSVADLTPGGSVAGAFSADLALWVPHPVPEPSTLLMQLCGVTFLFVLARRRARRGALR